MTGKYNTTYSKEDCIKSLQSAADKLGKSPTVTEYRSLDLTPSPKTMEAKFGSWPEAKKSAGLEWIEHGNNPRAVNRREETKSDVNAEYFKEINSPNKAYWLGFLFGDGCMRKVDGRMRLSLALQTDDRKTIEKFKADIGTSNQISDRKDRPMSRIQTSATEFCQHLWDKGLTDEKTFSAHTPNIEPDLRPDFVRGISDADGTVYNRAPNRACWGLASSSQERLETIAEWIPVTDPIIWDHPQSDKTQVLEVKSRERLIRTLKWLYPSGTETNPSMERKRKLAVDIIDNF